jgi:hypothetical protein
MFFINETKIRRFWPIAFKNDGQGPSIERVEGVFYCNGRVIGIVNEVSIVTICYFTILQFAKKVKQ